MTRKVTRASRVNHWIARGLAYAAPNSLTLLRLALTWLVTHQLFLAVRHDQVEKAQIYLFGYCLLAVSDFVDGYMANLWHSKTLFGKLADPFADKYLVFVGLGYLLRLLYSDIPAILWLSIALVAAVRLTQDILSTAKYLHDLRRRASSGSNIWGKAKTWCDLLGVVIGFWLVITGHSVASAVVTLIALSVATYAAHRSLQAKRQA